MRALCRGCGVDFDLPAIAKCPACGSQYIERADDPSEARRLIEDYLDAVHDAAEDPERRSRLTRPARERLLALQERARKFLTRTHTLV